MTAARYLFQRPSAEFRRLCHTLHAELSCEAGLQGVASSYAGNGCGGLRGGAIDFNINEDLAEHPMDMVYRGHWQPRRWGNGTIAVRSVLYRGMQALPQPVIQLIAVSKDGAASVLDILSRCEAESFAQDILGAIDDVDAAFVVAARMKGGAA